MFALLLIGGILVCGLVALRHAVRTAAPDPEAPRPTENRKLVPLDDWQGGIRLDAHPDYADAMKKLQREERRQRPEEQRN